MGIRDHAVYTIVVDYTKTIQHRDVNDDVCGVSTHPHSKDVFTVVAPKYNAEYAKAWVLERYKFQKDAEPLIIKIETVDLDAFIEHRTY